MIYTVTLNPALDKTAVIPNFRVDGVNRMEQLRTDPGGKGINVSKVIQKLGAKSVALGILAGHSGQQIAQSLEEMGLSCNFTFVPGETRTNLKIVDPVGKTHTDINEPGQPVAQEVLNALLESLLRQLQPGDMVVLSGSLPKGAAPDTYGTWTRACGERGAKVLLDADGDPLRYGLAAKPWLVKPNDKELARLLGESIRGEADLISAGKKLREQGIARVVISLGAEGALFFFEDGAYRAKGLSVPVGSTVGAGDSMVAALAVACEKQLSDGETVALAMATSAANVMCSGTQAAEWEVIEKLRPNVDFERI